MPAWATDMIGVFLGAVLGALFGYAASRWQGRQEATARRHALFRVLSDQLHMLRLESAENDATRMLKWVPVHVSAADQLLNGHVLDARSDAKLIRLLINWQSIEASYNEILRVYNQSSITESSSPVHGRSWYDRLDVSVKVLGRFRSDLLAQLPVAYRSPSWPEELGTPPDKGRRVESTTADVPQSQESGQA